MFKNAPIRVDHKWLYTQSDPAIIGHISDDVAIKRHKGEVALCSTLNIDNDDNLPEYNELSPGYLSDNKWQPGVAPNGEPYEILCTKINCINHLAIVHEARGGKDMKILDGGNNMKKIIHSGLIRAIKKRLTGVMDGTDNQSFESVVDEIGSTLQNIDDEGLKAKTASLIGYCDDLPDSDEKEKLLRYIADIPLLKDEDKEVAEEALKCIKESYNTLDSDANSEIMEKPMEDTEKKEQTPAQTPAQAQAIIPVYQAYKEILADYKSPRFDYLPSFTGGLVGYFSYDYLTYSEPTVKCDVEDTEAFKDVDLMLFDKVIAFDLLRQKIILIVNMPLDEPETGYNKAVMELNQLVELLRNGEKKNEPGGKLLGEVTPLFNKEQFCGMVEKAKHHIREGDIFQIVLSNRLSAPFEGSLLNTYRMLRTINPSPYMFYFSGTDVEVAGASPETLVKLENGVLHTFPLAGTRPRGRTDEEDKALEAELLADEKELAEHNMLVDLGRNDLGKISKFGTVQVEKLHSIERYSHVMHIGSTVRGEIYDNHDALDAIEAVLPAGTLSGAPKIRACQLIGELENNKRGIYGGAIGYIDFTGNMDTCIAIRIAYKKNGKVFVRSGAGIVADSVPEKEFEECLNKAKSSLKALELAQEGEL